MHRSCLLLLPLSLVVALLAGCGQKGPLVLPPPRPSATSNVAKPHVPAPAAASTSSSAAPAPASSTRNAAPTGEQY